MKVKYSTEFDGKLRDAVGLVPNHPKYKYMVNEYDEEFYKYSPSFPPSEPQVIGFHA